MPRASAPASSTFRSAPTAILALAGRRGFDSLTQAASGFNLAEAKAAGSDAPRALPAQALDHGAGYLAALGAIAALHRQRIEGGSWHVQVSLAQTGHWLRGLGRVAGAMDRSLPTLDDVRPGWRSATPASAACWRCATPPEWR
ncbi:Predicted acyl-CoA transferases/carnitine dehydratase [Chromobacterium violaceum]|uniref:Predicted acyl-CoA transferases/carnitine dehydratase n=1 Tax=Chromobacterium violaceum TaxID=536 RepID=A0A3S4HNZ8_CHRVL|nr:Predicted acyl-CoA transferases/carnitine dehydratase [Chromobacterium violaceum]